MDRQTEVNAHRAYLSTGNPAYLPRNLQKTAAVDHSTHVNQWRARLAGGMDKTARGGHPANIAFARAMRPGLFPGLDEGGSRIRMEPSGASKQDAMASFFEDSINPDTQAYYRGDHHYDHEKAASGITSSPRLTHNLSDRLKQTTDRIQGGGTRTSHITAPPPAMGAPSGIAPTTGLPQTPGGLGEDGMQVTQPKNVQTPTTTMPVMAKAAANMGLWWERLEN